MIYKNDLPLGRATDLRSGGIIFQGFLRSVLDAEEAVAMVGRSGGREAGVWGAASADARRQIALP